METEKGKCKEDRITPIAAPTSCNQNPEAGKPHESECSETTGGQRGKGFRKLEETLSKDTQLEERARNQEKVKSLINDLELM